MFFFSGRKNSEHNSWRDFKPWMSSSVVSGITCSPRDPRFAGSNPAEVDEFFQDVKILSTSPGGPESEILGSLKNLKP